MGIPIVIGVTGHRALRTQDLPILRAAVSRELKRLQETYPSSSFVMLNSIASGADTLCAEVALELGMRLICPLPMPAGEYRRDFSGADAAAYDTLLARAERVFVAPDAEPAQKRTREYHYRQAGIYVASHSHVLLALWDGSPAKPGGCGTAEIVAYMLSANDEIGCGCFKAANDGAVLHLFTPQQGDASESFQPEIRLLENEPGSLKNALATTDAFNADANETSGRAERAGCLVADDALPDLQESLRQIHAAYQAADHLSLRFQANYLRAIRCFSVFGALLVLFFLLYDEMESNLFLICYGLLILIYVLAFVRISKGQAHEKYLRYRMLCETLRTQFYLRATGSDENIGNAFTWTQKEESTWIKQAVSALLIGEPARQALSDEAIKQLWIEGQLAYHERAFRRASNQHNLRESTAKWMLTASFALFLLVLALEFVFASAMTTTLFAKPLPPLMLYHSGQTVTLRNLMKILLGAVSAMTVFLANYYGKLSLGRKSIDHGRMARLYAAAKEQYESGQISRAQLFAALAREEIIEIGNWFSYSRENPPSLQV